MKGLWVVTCLSAAITVSAQGGKKPPKEVLSPILIKFRTSYKHVHKGVKEDLVYYEKMLKTAKGKLDQAKSSRLPKAKKLKLIREYQDVMTAFEELIKVEKQLLDFFEGKVKKVDLESLMDEIVKLEQKVKSAFTLKRKRSWLTFDEYQVYLKRGWRPKQTRDKGVLPFARDLWEPPKKD